MKTVLKKENNRHFVWTNPAEIGKISMVKFILALPFGIACAIDAYAANVSPTISILTPVSNAPIVVPGAVELRSTTSDADGTVTKVAYYRNGNLLFIANFEPWYIRWNNAPVGTFTLTAKATDDQGAVTTSAPVTVVVKANVPPSVNIATPGNNADFHGPASISFTANAADTDGSVSKVDYYNDAVLLGSSNSAPYAFTWNNVTAGAYSVKAKATDSNGGTTVSAPVTLTVRANIAPSVSMTATPRNAVAPATVTLLSEASDTDGSVARVEFYNGENLLHTATEAPYAYTWANVAAGTYSVAARAVDNSGAYTTTDASQIVVTSSVGQLLYFAFPDQINTTREITNTAGNVVWRAGSEPFGASPPDENPSGQGVFTYNMRFPGQYFDRESGLHYNYFRDYDPQTGRYVQRDPIGLGGGINSYAYVENAPLMSVDPKGLKPWDYNGRGDTNVCTYYAKRARETCGKQRDYYVRAEQICKGNRWEVNLVMDAGISTAWARGSTDQSQAAIYNQVRSGLIQNDTAFANQFGTRGVTGNMIDYYHDVVFDGAGIGSNFYGGNLWPQGVAPNPVPFDLDGKSSFDPRRNFPKGDSDKCECKAN